MCSITTNKTVDSQLENLERSANRNMIEKRLFQMADGADVTKAGGLDNPALLLKYMPEDLSGVRHITIGRHRVYFLGYHTQCRYRAFYIKEFKRSGVDDDGSKSFQKKLRAALGEPQEREIHEEDFTA